MNNSPDKKFVTDLVHWSLGKSLVVPTFFASWLYFRKHARNLAAKGGTICRKFVKHFCRNEDFLAFHAYISRYKSTTRDRR